MNESVDSASDDRTRNNVMRHSYRVLTDAEKVQMSSIKDAGLAFVNLCDGIGKSRELSLAVTKAEEAVMWAVKHLTADKSAEDVRPRPPSAWYSEGWEAFKAGNSMGTIPYKTEPERKHWIDGWMGAKADGEPVATDLPSAVYG